MRTHTNLLLTIIAGCLVWLCVVATWPQWVASAEAGSTLTVVPVLIPSGGTAQITGPSDAGGVGILTCLYDDEGLGGTFLPSNTVQNPQYIAPVNMTDEPLGGGINLTATTINGGTAHWGVGIAVLPAGQIFADVPADYWARAQIEQCYAEGIVNGYPDGKYHPEETVTRAQMAVYMSRALAVTRQ